MGFLVGFTASHSRFTQEVWLESSDSLTSQLDDANKRQNHGDIYRVLSRNACNGGFGTEGFVTWKLKW